MSIIAAKSRKWSVMRIGAVNYLNSKPLVYGLEAAAPDVRLFYDLPSRLADSLSADRHDVALVPSVEWLRQPGHVIVSDACVACRGPVLSVKLYFRVPPAQVRRLALDVGSRTSAALARILLDELAGVTPECEPLPIGCGLDSTDADAVLLIGDRAIQSREQGARSREISDSVLPIPCSLLPAPCYEVWDLGEKWFDWTGLPFVFAAWIARPNVETAALEVQLAAARDRGVASLAEIAAAEAPVLGIETALAFRYLRDNLHFTLGEAELGGLKRFAQLAADRGFVSEDAVQVVARVGRLAREHAACPVCDRSVVADAANVPLPRAAQ
jgi:chorismate dehydratase